MNRSESVNSSLSSCCSLGRSTKRPRRLPDVYGIRSDLERASPGREGDHKGRPCVLRVSVWLACRSRRHASASEHLRHNPTVAGLSICVASQPILNFWRAPSRTVWAGAGLKPALPRSCVIPPADRGFIIRLSISLVKGALTLDAAILLCAGADARRRWRLVVIVVHALWDVKRGLGGFGDVFDGCCLNLRLR